jgi:hypothetical protein
MNQTAKYKEQLFRYLDSKEEETVIIDWIETLPALDQPEILRELKTLFIENHEKTGEQDSLEKANIIEASIEQFEDSILDDKLAENLFITELQGVLNDTEKIKAFLALTRTTLINCILKSSDDNKEIWVLVHKAIKAEEESDLYDPDNWSVIM